MIIKNKLNAKYRSILFELLRQQINPEMWREHAQHIQTCRLFAAQPVLPEWKADPLYVYSETWRQQILTEFADRYKALTSLRVMVHVPASKDSMGGASLFQNWIDGLRFLGIEATNLPWKSDAAQAIKSFAPSVLITSDSSAYTEQIDWGFIDTYREQHPLAIILTASHQLEGNTPNQERLARARERGVDFFVSFREPEYIQAWFQEWFEHSYEVVSIPFSANPLIYSYLPFPDKPLDYVFLASSNSEKVERYWQYLRPIFSNYRGVINGPGWGQDKLVLGREHHRFLYALSEIGINLHIPVSMDQISEINERAYILACCGLFQITDRPQSLGRVFPADAIVSADTPAEYRDKFEYYLRHPVERMPFIQRSLECIYTKHTIFHRMDLLIQRLMKMDELKSVVN